MEGHGGGAVRKEEDVDVHWHVPYNYSGHITIAFTPNTMHTLHLTRGRLSVSSFLCK